MMRWVCSRFGLMVIRRMGCRIIRMCLMFRLGDFVVKGGVIGVVFVYV